MQMMWYPNFAQAETKLRQQLKTCGQDVRTETWQGVDVSAKPEMQMRELMFQSFRVPLPTALNELRADVKANQPWAEGHFLERVCGEPVNPGETWRTWPWGHSADKFRDENGQFNHNYMERYWPKYAGVAGETFNHAQQTLDQVPHCGIRYRYGDLNDVVDLLAEQPFTRQAYLPVWFPEDTGVVHRDRAPCTLGYHFFQRGGYLHIVYYIRSCDLVRHFADDCYLTARLVYWMLDRLRERSEAWNSVAPGQLVMHITSLHCFVNDVRDL